MRRPFALALASLTLGIGSIFVGAQGCTSSALGVQDLCGWLADECNCYRRFAAGVANSTVTTVGDVSTGVKPMCGVQLDSNKNAINSATNTIYPAAAKPTIGTFLSREKLDICILTGSEGGQIVFDPPLDPLAFPPTNFAFKILDGTGKLCGNGSYGSSTSFSIGFPAPEGTGGTGGAGGGGGGGAGGAGGGGLTCRGDSGANNEDPAREAITYGTFTIAATDPTNIVETACPNDEKHRFNLLQLEKCDGSGTNDGVTEENYKALMPTAEVEATAGGINIPGEVRLRISWPQSEPVDTLNGGKSIQVEYFDCLFPGDIHPCLNGEQDGAEVAPDCGYVACGGGCADGLPCTQPLDCTSGLCVPNAKGLKECVGTPCGDSAKNGTETCDDGNTNDGDGCSASCAQEPGFICTGAGPGSCVDIPECEQTNPPPCGANATCTNTPGSFTCTCNAGFSGDGMTCTPGCGDGVKGATEACDDSNTNDGDGCTKNCAAEPGYICMGAGPGSCVDIIECTAGTDTCLDTEDCTNTPGSFTCTCKPANKVCNGTCIEVSADVFNCGDCGVTCLPGQVCTAGVCGAAP